MNKTLLSRESVLCAAKELVAEHDLQNLNMRSVAQRCGVAVGSIYNYFPSKGDLLIAAIESIWKEIMVEMQGIDATSDFLTGVQTVYSRIQAGCKKYPRFLGMHLMSASSVDLVKARRAMGQYMSHIKQALLQSLEGDLSVRPERFSAAFSRSDLVDFVFSNVILFLTKEEDSCGVLLEVIERVIHV